jgi:hypothetical protein
MVPRLLERLTETSEEESMMVADLVCQSREVNECSLMHFIDSEGHLYCQIRRYEELKGRCFGVDNPERCAFASTPHPERQDE